MFNIEKRIKNIISIQLDKKKEKLNPFTRFVEDLGADSLDMIELFMSLEEEFNVHIPDEDMEKIIDIQSASLYIQKKCKKNI